MTDKALWCRGSLASAVDRRLSSLDKSIIELVAFLNFDGTGCWWSQRQMALALECSYVSISRRMTQLIEWRHILVTAHPTNRKLAVYWVNYDMNIVSLLANNPLRQFIDGAAPIVSLPDAIVSIPDRIVNIEKQEVVENKAQFVLQEEQGNRNIQDESLGGSNEPLSTPLARPRARPTISKEEKQSRWLSNVLRYARQRPNLIDRDRIPDIQVAYADGDKTAKQLLNRIDKQMQREIEAGTYVTREIVRKFGYDGVNRNKVQPAGTGARPRPQ